MNDQERFQMQCENNGNRSQPIYKLSTDELQQVAGGMKNPVRVVITGTSRGELAPVPSNARRVAVVTGGIGGLGTAM